MSTDSAQLERRCGQRFQLHLPLVLHVDGRTAQGYAQDVSARGIYLFSEAALPEGALLELTFTMPSEVTLADSMRVRARGRVLRTTAAEAGPTRGMAVQLASYEFLSSLECETAGDLARISASDASGARGSAVSR